MIKNKQLFRNDAVYVPKDIDGTEIGVGDSVIVPEPLHGDLWQHGNFSARVEDCNEITGHLIVIDQDGDFWEVEPARVEVAD